MLSLSLREALHQVKNGHISSKELCEKCMERSVRVRDLNAFITETPDVCMEQIKRLEKQPNKTDLRLIGAPIAVKDNFCTRNVRTSCASKMLDNFRPPYTATVVQRLLDQGSVLVGKTNMDEFAMGCGSTDSFYGPVFNPWRFRFKNKSRSKNNIQKHVVWINKLIKVYHQTVPPRFRHHQILLRVSNREIYVILIQTIYL